MHKETLPGIYRLMKPPRSVPVVFDSPHSGTDYPEDFQFACPFPLLEKAEDKFVDNLFAAAPDYGATLLCADFPRSYIDVNRCAKDIDPDLIDEGANEQEFRPTARSHAGIGLIRRLVRPGLPLYDRTLSIAEIRHRIEYYYWPYHKALQKEIEAAHYRFGQVWHVNCHSMPTQEFSSVRASGFRQPDFVLGDRDGTSCAIEFTHAMRDFLRGLGYHVTINDPYKGVELVQRYSSPATGRHSIQVEIARSLYLDEETYEKSRGYDGLKLDVERLIGFCVDYAQSQSLPLAAD